MLLRPQLGGQEPLWRAGVAGEEEGSVGDPAHIVQAAENSRRASLCRPPVVLELTLFLSKLTLAFP